MYVIPVKYPCLDFIQPYFLDRLLLTLGQIYNNLDGTLKNHPLYSFRKKVKQNLLASQENQ